MNGLCKIPVAPVIRELLQLLSEARTYPHLLVWSVSSAGFKRNRIVASHGLISFGFTPPPRRAMIQL
jgi:hypothetical protein